MSLRPLRAAVAAWTPGRTLTADPLHAIMAAWGGIVGEHVAAHAAPLELAGPALVVATRSSAWSQQLQFLSETVVAGVRSVPGAATVTRLTFRSGALRATGERGRSPRPRATPGQAVARPQEPAPAADAAEALARVRARVTALQRAAESVCPRCGAVRAAAREASAAPAAPDACAPCAGFAREERALAAERLMYLCPWLEPDAVREHVPDLPPGEVERIRRRLLQRWWLVLERARRAQRLSRSGLERSLASSYVLLQSRLPPDRITPAVVRNLLGAELEGLLWPNAAPEPERGAHRASRRRSTLDERL